MALGLRAFFDLLPARLDQALIGSAIRKDRVKRRRKTATPTGPNESLLTQRPQQLFVDVGVIAKCDAGTGIQRVVRALALGLSECTRDEWNIHFVSAARRKKYRKIAWPNQSSCSYTSPIEGQRGDVFLGLDYSLNTVRWHRTQLEQFKRNGGSVWFFVHDLLPLQRPDWFSRNTVVRYQAWLDVIAGLANGFLCNSDQTQQELEQVLVDRYGITDGYSIGVVTMGANIRDSMLDNDTIDARDALLKSELAKPFTLMVGTVEPRKGHADVIAAFEELWTLRRHDRLVIVGRRGWQVEDLCARICSHPEYGRKLVWLDDVDDIELDQIYRACEGMIMASHAEGFGLPLIEALGHGKPVLARDLAVFRPHEAHGVRYFPADANGTSLANHIMNWIGDVRSHKVLMTKPKACWRQSAREVLQIIEHC